MKKLRIGIIGCGTILSVHLEAIEALDQGELVLVCDIKEVLAKEVATSHQCEWTTDYKEVLKRDDVDVVHILLPHYLHVPVAKEVLMAGKHVILEKPVGISMEELEDLRWVALESNCTLGVTFQNRFNPTTIKAMEVIESGLLGPFKGSKGVLTWSREGTYYSESDWRGRLAMEGGGLLINQGIHTLDLMAYIGGKVASIWGIVVNTSHPDIEVEDTALVTFRYQDGTIGNFYGTNSYGENSEIEMEFLYEKGKLVFENQQLILVKEGKEEIIASDIVKKGNKSYWGMSHKLIIGDIYDSIIEKRQPKVTLDDAIRATELVLGAYESSMTGKWYEITKPSDSTYSRKDK